MKTAEDAKDAEKKAFNGLNASYAVDFKDMPKRIIPDFLVRLPRVLRAPSVLVFPRLCKTAGLPESFWPFPPPSANS